MHTNGLELSEQAGLFPERHIGPTSEEIQKMLHFLGCSSLDELISSIVPGEIRTQHVLQLGQPREEFEVLNELRKIADRNQVFRSYIGMGYYDCNTPTVILRNILENPGWYTQYTPYQAEIAQGRLEALLNYQTLIKDFTGFAIANASMLDESTSAAEAMAMCFGIKGKDPKRPFFVSNECHPQTISLIQTRAEPLGIRVVIGDHNSINWSHDYFAMLLQYPSTTGTVYDYREWIERAHSKNGLVIIAADLLSLALLVPPAELGADVAIGTSQRFGVPLGYGGPHAAYFATHDEYKRQIPGRIVGLSKDLDGKPAVRLALQTREQHIRRDKATSNICTSQVLLAVIASMYAVYHGPKGIRKIAERIHFLASVLKHGLEKLGYNLNSRPYFDTLSIRTSKLICNQIVQEARTRKINLRIIDPETIGVSLDETTSEKDVEELMSIFSVNQQKHLKLDQIIAEVKIDWNASHFRKSSYLNHPVFHQYHSETEMLRYIHRLQSRDLSLTTSMIPLGSCTMKLNATSEMIPISWPEFNKIHPFVPLDQVSGYQMMLKQLEEMLAEITGFSAVSLQPNAGSQGEFAGLLVIRKYFEGRGEKHRNVCLIPKSAHGTNPASAAMAGLTVIAVECDKNGNIDVQDLKEKIEENRTQLAVLMVTYPSTHGVFEESIKTICSLVHQSGGQVYMDGANMNAQIGLCRPGEFGPDVCHLNLHKTFCIPHGGGGPGMGPIAVAKHLQPYLPSHPFLDSTSSFKSENGIGPVSAAPWGSPSILPISWMYISMMGGSGLKRATEAAILNANYIAKKLSPYFPVLYTGKNGRVAHECIFDLRHLKDTAGVEVEDVAKRLMDYGFHAPTISFPVSGTLMVEPTESETKAELDRFCEALMSIRDEIREIEEGKADRQNNVLKNAPHTAEQIARDEWNHPYSRSKAVFPLSWVRDNKFWPSVARINNVLGDRNLICSCPMLGQSTD